MNRIRQIRHLLAQQRVDGEVTIPVRFSHEVAGAMLTGWWPCRVGAMTLRFRDDLTCDLFLQPSSEAGRDVLDVPWVQSALMAAYDLISEIEADEALLPDRLVAKAVAFRELVAARGAGVPE